MSNFLKISRQLAVAALPAAFAWFGNSSFAQLRTVTFCACTLFDA